MARSKQNREANIWIARGIPVFLLGIIGYGSWVMTKVLCVDYLLNPPSLSYSQPQTGPAIAILTIYYVVLFITLVSYARLLYVVSRHPGLVPRGSQWVKAKHTKHRLRQPRSRRQPRDSIVETKGFDSIPEDDGYTAEAMTRAVAVDADLKVENFWKREVFTCKYDGRPDFCTTCYNWKPDRTHHCSELGRCVLKMDHFCPWVGGVVGETSFKFFIQFTFWGALYCTHVLVSISYYFAHRRQNEGTINVHWTVLLAISAFFLFFSGGMCMSSLQFVFINSTTIENLSRKRKVWYLAVHIPDRVLQQLEERGRNNLRFITYPRPPNEQFQALEQNGVNISREASDNALQPEDVSTPGLASRTFAILETTPGVNPFDLGWKENFVDIMGTTLIEWILPLRASPCVRHESTESFYKMGTAVRHLKQEARIVDEDRQGRKRSKHRSRRSGTRSRTRSSNRRSAE